MLEDVDNTQVLLALSKERLLSALTICDFMIGPARSIADPDETLKRLAELIRDAGLPLDRLITTVGILHSEAAASVRQWDVDTGVQHEDQVEGARFSHPW